MKVITIVSVSILMTLTQSSKVDWGGAQLVFKQSGLTTVTQFLQEHMVLALRGVSFREYRLYALSINKIKVVKAEGIKTDVSVKPNNTIEMVLGFQDFHVEANVTVNNPGDILHSPATIINFKDASLKLKLHVGRGKSGDKIDVEDCHATIGDMVLENVSDQTESILKGVWRIGQSELSELFKELCPDLRNMTHSKYKDILGFEETFTVRGDGPDPIPMDGRINEIDTSESVLSISAATGIDGVVLPQYGSHDVTFPDPAELGHDSTKEVELWVNDDLLNLLGLKALQTDSAVPLQFTVFRKDEFMVETKNQVASMKSSKNGLALHLSLDSTFVQTNSGINCADLKIETDLILPFVLKINNTKLVMLPDPKRYQINMKIASLNIAFPNCGTINPRSEPLLWQKRVLDNFTGATERTFNGRFMYAKLWRDQYISFIDTTVETLEDCLILTANIGRGAGIIIEETITTTHKLYTDRQVQFTFADGTQETYVNGHKLGHGDSTSHGSQPSVSGMLTFSLTFCLSILHFL